MNVDLIFRIAGIGIIVSVLHTVIKQAGKEEYAWLATLAGIVIVLSMVIQVINQFFETVKTMFRLY
ncbi:MAG: stage III sporulation protein AC [Firmicutes bacterium]|jgi:stage III sporulation protein AC|nr:stage III sporulation protein AC [Bacillota bacterium]